MSIEFDLGFGFCMDVRRETIESGSLKHSSLTEACIIVHLACDDPCAWKTVFDYLETDAASSHYESAFVLVADNGASFEGTYPARGYIPLSGKD